MFEQNNFKPHYRALIISQLTLLFCHVYFLIMYIAIW